MFKANRGLRIILFLALVGSLGCERPPRKISMPMVIFAPTRAVLTRAGVPMSPKAGMRLQPGDSVFAGNGGLDIQFGVGSVLRLRKFGRLKLLRRDKSATRFELRQGSLIMRVERAAAGEVVELATSRAVIRVLGTTFSARVDENGEPRVRVYAGRVALVPTGGSEPGRKHLLKLMSQKEIILDAGQSATMAPGFRVALRKLRLASEGEARGKREARRDFIEPRNLPVAFTSEKIAGGTRGERERATLVTLNHEFFRNEQNDHGAEVKQAYHRELKRAVERIQARARDKGHRTRAELLRVYGLLEHVRLADASTVIGVIFADAGHLLLMETETGMRKLEKNKITSVDFIDGEK